MPQETVSKTMHRRARPAHPVLTNMLALIVSIKRTVSAYISTKITPFWHDTSHYFMLLDQISPIMKIMYILSSGVKPSTSLDLSVILCIFIPDNICYM
jgi:hypothetical protein